MHMHMEKVGTYTYTYVSGQHTYTSHHRLIYTYMSKVSRHTQIHAYIHITGQYTDVCLHIGHKSVQYTTRGDLYS